jgi:hypothetical protein
MSEAKRAGKLLSDVVEASWEHLRHATHPISYLRALLRAPVDFAYRVRQQRNTEQADVRRSECVKHVDDAINALAGHSFASQDGLRTYEISDDATSVTIRHRDETRPRVRAGNWSHEFVAAMEAGRIVPMVDGSDDARGSNVADASIDVTPDLDLSRRRLNDLKQMLRLKHARLAPSRETKVAVTPGIQQRRTSFPLSSLLQTISGVRATRA